MLINIVGVDFDSGYGASKLLACLPRLALRVFEPDPSVIIGGPKLGFLLRSTYVQQLLGTNNLRPSIALAREPVVFKQAEHANLDVRGSCTPCRVSRLLLIARPPSHPACRTSARGQRVHVYGS